MRPASLFEGLGVFRAAPDARSVDDVDGEIREELELHLALRTEANIAAGMDPDAARRDAEARFGDVEKIRRSCRRVQLGERIMLQRAKTALLGVLVIAVGFLAVDSYLMRRETTASMVRMSSAMNEMTWALRGEEPPAFEARGLVTLPELFASRQPREVVIRVGDQLKIQDFNNVGLDITERVARDGMVLVPDVGWVPVAGLTRAEVEKTLSEAYAPFYASPPDVKVKVVE